MADHAGYRSSHPWYYKLGGRILTPDEIRSEVERDELVFGDTGLVETLDRMKEPRRSRDIRNAIAVSEQSQARNIERYNEVTAQLLYERERPGPYEWDERRMWSDPTTATCLKHNHISYEHATQMGLKSLIGVQMELF